MPALVSGAVWLGVVLYLLSRALRQAAAYRATTLRDISGQHRPAAVSIIVPIRNERHNITNCITGLTGQIGLAPESSITIVDDGSEDGTTAVIRRHVAEGRPLRLMSAGSLPEGWVGKAHACWAGAMAAAAGWLCFVDADVGIDARLVAAAVGAAVAQDIDMLSLHPFQELGSFSERLLIPAGLLMLACAKPVDTAAAALPSASEANGQFILIRREVYFAVGGHAAIASEICEDKAMAERVTAAGFRFRSAAAEHLASTRMYRDLHSLWEGLAKNAIEALDGGAKTLVASLVGMLLGWAALLVPMTVAVAALRSASAFDLTGLGLACGGSAVVLAVQLGTARHFRIPVAYGFIMMLGYTMVALLVCYSLFLRVNGRVAWKGRRYDLRRNPSRAGL
jgi:chlorobactene glucosyltransferase